MKKLQSTPIFESTLFLNGYNFVFFQFAWFIAVLSTSHLAMALVTPLLLLQLWIGDNWQRDIRTGLAFTLVGGLTESFLMGSASYSLNQSINAAIDIPPSWLLLMWFCLGLSTNYSLAWLRTTGSKPWLLQIAFAAVGAPLAYSAAETLNAITLSEYGLFHIGLSWAVAFPIGLLMTHVPVKK